MMKIIYIFLTMLIAAEFSLCGTELLASDMDSRIESAAKQSYVFKTYLKNDDVRIQSKNGVVILVGTVSDEYHKSLAQETVASLPGVATVDNKLEIKGQMPAAFTDGWLLAKVKSALLFHRNVNAAETEVFVKDGTVTLRGNALSETQKDLTAAYAKDVDGVKNVINQMNVTSQTMRSSKTTLGGKIDALAEKMDAMGESIDDASTTALVKTTLLYHRSTSALNITVETKDGVVKLGGKAKTTAEKDMATKFVSDVYGVKQVVNNIMVQ